MIGGGLLGSSQLPSTWIKPVIDSLVTPAHAQATTTTNPPVSGEVRLTSPGSGILKSPKALAQLLLLSLAQEAVVVVVVTIQMEALAAVGVQLHKP